MDTPSSGRFDIQEFLAVSAQYLGLEPDSVDPVADRGIPPFTAVVGADRSLHGFEELAQRCA